MTMNDTWGFKSFDDGWKDTRTLLRTMIDIASKGGNFLLNVGPTSLGELPPESVERLREMGRWMQVNGESIHGTTASPFGAPSWGRYTAKRGGGVVFAHVFDWPKNNALVLTGITTKPKAAYLLADRKPLVVDQSADGFVVRLPAEGPSKIASVVVLETGS
jgi:alpha-L-fucosidase